MCSTSLLLKYHTVFFLFRGRACVYGTENRMSDCVGDKENGTCRAAVDSDATDTFTQYVEESGCIDQHTSCEQWAATGECDANPKFMLLSCRASCGVCHGSEGVRAPLSEEDPECSSEDVCRDCNPFCSQWAASGQCRTNPTYMLRSCAISCGVCQAGDPHPEDHPDCQDFHESCEHMAEAGACHVHRSRMLRDCQHSCHVCGEQDPCRPNASDPGIATRPGLLNMFFRQLVRKQNVTVLNSDPYVLLLHNAISHSLADRVLEIFSSGWERSFVGGVTNIMDDVRTSEQQWCARECLESAAIKELTERVENILQISSAHFDYLQILRYRSGQHYKSHTDFVPGFAPLPMGPRVLTFFLYLNDVETGGATHFPKLKVSVPPRKGEALLWSSVLDSDPFKEDERTVHEGRPPLNNSVKLAMNFWLFQYKYRQYIEMDCLWPRRPRSSYVPLSNL